MLKRRSFLAAVLALAAWPFTRVRAHENAVKALPKPTKWPDRVVLRVRDGETVVDDLWVSPANIPGQCLTSYPGERYGYIDGRHVGPDQAVFRRTWVDQLAGDGKHAITTIHYEYDSGPKWWADFGGAAAPGKTLRFQNGTTIRSKALPAKLFIDPFIKAELWRANTERPFARAIREQGEQLDADMAALRPQCEQRDGYRVRRLR